MGKNYFDQFDETPAMQLSPPAGVTEVAPPGSQGFISLGPVGTQPPRSIAPTAPASISTVAAPASAPLGGGGNYFDRFDLMAQPPTLPAWPDWMTGSTSSFGPNGLPDWMTDSTPAPASPAGGNFFDQFDEPAPPAPSWSVPNNPPSAANPSPIPVPTPQPASGLNPRQGRGQEGWNAGRAQAAANPPVPSPVPTPSPAPTPVTWEPNGTAYQIRGDQVVFDPDRFGIGVDQAKRHGVLGHADYYMLKGQQAQIEQALLERRNLETEAGKNAALKAALAGVGKGAAELGGFMAGASASQPAVGPIAAATGPYSVIVEPVGTGIGGGLGAYGAGALYDKALREIAARTGHFRDVLAARQLMPGYDQAGQLMFVAASAPLSATRLAQGFRMIQAARGTPEAAKFLARTAGLGGASSAISGAVVDGVAHRIDPKHNPGPSLAGGAQNFLLGSLAGPSKWPRSVEIPDGILEGSGIRELRASAKGYAKGAGMIGTTYLNRATGRKLLVDGDTLSHIYSNLGPVHLHLVPWLPGIIRDAVPLTLNENHEPRIVQIRKIQRLVLPIKFRGQSYLITLTAKDHIGAKGLHLYDVKAVPVGGVGSAGKVLPPGAAQGPRRNGPTTDPTPFRK